MCTANARGANVIECVVRRSIAEGRRERKAAAGRCSPGGRLRALKLLDAQPLSMKITAMPSESTP